MNTQRTSSGAKRVICGAIAGIVGTLGMVLAMSFLRRHLGVATPTEMIFDRMFPIITIDMFLKSLQVAGGYTPLKLDGVYGALAGHALVGVAIGAIYGWLAGKTVPTAWEARRRGVTFLIGALGFLWLATVALLWPQFATQYRGWPVPISNFSNAFALLIIYGGFGVMVGFIFHLLCPQYWREVRLDSTTTVVNEPVEEGNGRRVFIATGIGAMFAVGLAASLKGLYRMGTFFYDGTDYSGPRVQKIVPNNEFYVVSKNLVDPVIAANEWTLTVAGAVEREQSFTLADLKAMTPLTQEATLLCISYGVGGGLASNAVWTGVSLPKLLEPLGPKSDVSTVVFRAADGYFETFPYNKAQEATTLVAYAMNNAPIPARHGYPVRLIVPGLYGEKSAKWVTRIELLSASDARLHADRGYGFYKQQGWGPNFLVPIHSRFDAPLVAGDKFAAPFHVGQETEIRGMAFSGDQGISKVEVSTDDGRSWSAVDINQPGTKISWSLWRYDWTPTRAGEQKLIVRATDGAGRPQVTEPRNTTPQGALGLHAVTAKIEA